MKGRILLLGLGLGLVAPMQEAGAFPDREQGEWARQKCANYERAWHGLTAEMGRTGIRDEFVRANERFIAEGCSSGVDICPSTEQELSLANALTIDSMNFGTASTFLPFVCRQPKR